MDRGTARTPFRRVGPGAAVLTGARTREVTSSIEVRVQHTPRSAPALLRIPPAQEVVHNGLTPSTAGRKGLPPRTSRRHGRSMDRRRAEGPRAWATQAGRRRAGGRAGIGRRVARRGATARDRDAVHGCDRRCAGRAHRPGSAGRNSPRRVPLRQVPLHTPGRCGRSRRSRWRSGSRRTASARVTAAWIWPRRRAPPCSPPQRAPWCSPELWPAAAWCRSSTRTVCEPPTNRWPRASRGGRRSRREPCWARSSPVTGRAGRPACTGVCVASGAAISTRSCCSCRGTCGCCRCSTRSQRDSSTSRARSRATSRPCSWLTRDSVTPSIRPISARVRSSR